MGGPVNWPDWPEVRRRAHTPSRPHSEPPRRRWIWLIFGLILLLLFGGRTWLSYYVDTLWFGSLGYAGVFWTSLRWQWGVFAAAGAATFVILYGAFLVLKHTQFPDTAEGQTILIGGRMVRLPVGRMLRLAALAASLLIALLTASTMMAMWETFALYWHVPGGGPADPIFGRPLDFYLFVLPVWDIVSGWLLMLAVFACLMAGFFLLVNGGARALEGFRNSYQKVSWRAMSLAFALLLAVIAWRVDLGRYDLLFADHKVFSGVTYTDAHVLLPGLLALVAALLLGAAMAAANAWLNRARWLFLAIVPAALCYVVLQVAAWYVGNFVVRPNELVREKPYIVHNIQGTRQAFALDDITRHDFSVDLSPQAADPAQNQPTLENIRLWDWRALQDTLRQIQEIRTYYDFPDIDIDRYQVNGRLREVMLAARELNLDKLPDTSRNWINERLIYTHGYGVTMNPVNGFTPEGLPTLWLSDMPVNSTVAGVKVARPEIYFGELTNSDVYVKTRQKEFNFPQGQQNSFTEYQGTGGIEIGGFVRRVLLAMDRGDLGKLPFSDDVTPQSRLLMRRNVVQRVSTLAPFLTFDPDPYLVIGDDGRLFWMMDAYTTTDTYPYSTHYRLGDQMLSYMRNSVKVVVDAYNGAATFYAFDNTDPLLAAYRRLFPSLFREASDMPADLRRHVRYPELLLEMQAQVYALYHMTDPEVFYNKEDLWNVASEVSMNQQGGQVTETMQPAFVLMKLPNGNDLEFVEILPFTPANRNNLIGWIGGRSDGEHYGRAVVYDFPKTKLVDGPLQIEARIDQNAELSGQLSLWNQQGSRVRRGSLLVIPIGHTLLYAEPIYLQAERSPMPELRLVVLALQDKLAYGPTFESALASLFGSAAPTGVVSGEANAAQPSSGSAAPAADFQALIAQAAQDLADYQKLTAEGKLGEAGQKLEHLKSTLEKLQQNRK